MLEQISGSQSLSSAVDRVFTVRGTHVLSLCVVVVWALSPIGGQSSSRLLGEGLDPVISNSQVYFANPEYQSSTSDSASGWKDYKNVVYMVYSSVLFSVSSKRAALADPWDRPKLPQLSQAVIETSNFTWQEYDQQTNLQAGEDFASLLGVDIQGLRIDDPTMTSNFSIEMSYIDMDCKRAIAFKPLNSTYTSSFVATIVRNNDSSGAAWFWNNSRNGHRLSYDTRLTTDTGSHLGSTVFECVMRRIPVEAEIFCGPFPSTGCGVRRQRLRQAKSDPAPDGSYGTELDGMYQILPWSMGIPTLQNMVKDWPSAGGSTDVVEEASATDNFLAGDDFLYQSQHMRDWDSDATDMALFSRRMTTMFNTMFHATLDPWNATRSDLTRIPDTGNTTVDGYFYPNYTTTQATLTGQQSVYLANHPWCGLLLFIGSVVQLLAIASLCLRAIINAPDILGFASSFTRDNPYFPIRPSGSALGGAERARLLKDLRVQIADVIPTENVGYIAVRPVSDDLNNGGQPSVINSLEGQLQWRIRSGKRSYL